MSGNQLGGFLRARREAVRPADVGLPDGSRRRTPGLRRAELATLAGISVDYLTRLEQGRDRHPSAQVLAVLADALRLSGDERRYLRQVAKSVGGTHCLEFEPPGREVRPSVRALLDRLEPAPAFVANRLGDLLAVTSAFQRLAGPIGLLDGDPPNLLRFLFTDSRARSTYPEWGRVADQHVADLKLGSMRTDPHLAELVDELTVLAGAPFADRWASADIRSEHAGQQRLVHPELGELRLSYETLEVSGGDQRLVVQLPADPATEAAFDHLDGYHLGGLREPQVTG